MLETCSPESPVSSMETLSQEGSTERGVSVVTNARDKENNFSCSDTHEEKLFLNSVSSSLVISASCFFRMIFPLFLPASFFSRVF